MKRIISALVVSSFLLAGQALAAPDSVVFEGGDVRIKGAGNGLVFPDGTIQTTKTVQGPANTLAIGTVTTGASGSQAAASITGTSPNQTLNLTIPQGPQGTQGIQGPPGPPGVANGISKGVHGTIASTGVPSTGTGFSVVRSATGTYDITFSPAFSSTPDCVISPVGHSTTTGISYSFIDCELSTVSSPTFSASGARVECKYYFTSFPAVPTLIDATFTFICVQ